jgi:hypothetical protein
VMCLMSSDPSVWASMSVSTCIAFMSIAVSSLVVSGGLLCCGFACCLARAKRSAPITYCASFNLSLTLGVVLAAVDIDKPPDTGP